MNSYNGKNNLSKKNNGFTLVEIVVAVLIIAVLAGIIIPITLSIINSSNDADIAMDARNIWTASQTKFTSLQAENQHWLSDNASMGLAINQGAKKTDNKAVEFASGGFKGAFYDISNLKLSQEILNNIENRDNITTLYICTGKVYKYIMTDNFDYAYRVYLIVFKYKDDEKTYVYDGSKVSNEWPLYNPSKASSFNTGSKDLQLKKDLYVQFYRIKKTNKSGDPNSEFKSLFS